MVVSLASLFDEAGRVAVTLVLRAPPVPGLGDVSGGVPEPLNPSMGEAYGGWSSGTSPDGGAKGVRRPGEPRLTGQVGLAEKGDAIGPGLRAWFSKPATSSADGTEREEEDERGTEKGRAEESDEAWGGESRSEPKQRVEGEWDGESPGSDEILFTLALPPKRFT